MEGLVVCILNGIKAWLSADGVFERGINGGDD